MTEVTDETVVLLRSLVQCPSPSGQEEAVQRLIADWLRLNGVATTLQTTADGLSNVFATARGDRHGEAAPSLLLLGHADTVLPGDGWTRDPYSGVLEGHRLYGRGAVDMKAGLAAAMLAMRELARRSDWCGTVSFASVADEEASSRGAVDLIARGLQFDAAVVCEPHFDDPVVGGVGKINVRITCRGRSTHGSRPEEGVNAIDAMARLLHALQAWPMREHPLIGRGSRCVLRIESGDGPYEIRVPDRCSCLVNWHLVPGESADDVISELRALAESVSPAVDAIFDVLPPAYPSYLTAPDHSFLRHFTETYRREFGHDPAFAYGRGVSDANLLADSGIPTVMFGPSGANLHAADEWVDVRQIGEAARFYVALATSERTWTSGQSGHRKDYP